MKSVKKAGLLLVCFVLALNVITVQAAEFTANQNVYNELINITYDDMAYMPVNHWSSTAVYVTSAAGLIKGYDANFNPGGTVTKSEALAVLFRSSGHEGLANSYYSNILKSKEKEPYEYNNVDSWADGYIRLAVDFGILTPDEYLYCMSSKYNNDGEFQKNKPALKAELAKWIVKVYKLPVQKGESKISAFYDYSELKSEDKQYLETAVYYGILNGSGDRLDPYVTMTREQMAQIFYNIRNLWAEKLGYEILQGTISDVNKTTTQSEGKITNDIVISTDAGNLITQREYKLNGEAVDNTYDSGLLYKDFVVIAQGHLPTDSTILKKSDGISIFVKDSAVKFILKNKSGGNLDFSSEEFKDASVHKGRLYFYDADEMTLVLKTEKGFEEINCSNATEFSYRTNVVDKSKINDMYKDSGIYVFTCVEIAGNREFAYRVQITD